MRVLQAIETGGPGGAEQVLVRLCAALRDAGHEVRVALLRAGWLADRLADEGIEIDWLALRRPFDPGLSHGLRALVRQRRIDVVHTHEFTFAFYGRLALQGLRTPLVATAHGANFVEGRKRRLLGSVTLRPGGPFRLVAVSEALASRLAGALFLSRQRIHVVRNGIPVSPTDPRDVGPGPSFRLVAVGNLYPVKNHGALVRIVARLRACGVPAELDILGRGAEEIGLQCEIARLDLGAHVRLQGYRDDVERFLRAADVFVSSSLSEQMPLSFLEAMARGLPIVASRVGGVPEIVEPEVNGLLFAPGDETSAAALLADLWRDPKRRAALGERGRMKVAAHYSVGVMTSAYLRLYDHRASSTNPETGQA